MNTPVSFELAKMLKEKGFDVKVRGRIHVSHWHLVKDNIIPSNVNTYHTDMFAPLDNWNDEKQHFMSIPTIAEVVMWLYEKYGIWIVINFANKTQWYFDCNKIGFNGKDKKLFQSNYDFNSPTEAYEAAILYTLKNLIP